jgi:hypothetical protein
MQSWRSTAHSRISASSRTGGRGQESLAQAGRQHRKVVTRRIRWKVLPRLRPRADQGHELHLSVRNDRRKIEQSVRSAGSCGRS